MRNFTCEDTQWCTYVSCSLVRKIKLQKFFLPYPHTPLILTLLLIYAILALLKMPYKLLYLCVGYFVLWYNICVNN